MTNVDACKEQAARRAADLIASGMVVGLGTGSTARYALIRIAERMRGGELHDIVGIPSSRQTEAQAGELGIPLAGFADHAVIDLTLDGADEVDDRLNLIKGGGGALLREKVLAQASRRLVIMVDDGKLSRQLGEHWALPVEVVPFAAPAERRFMESLGAVVSPRLDAQESPFVTDQGNHILDAAFGPIADPAALAARLDGRAGIVEHGLFVGLTTDLVVAGPDGVLHRTA